MELVDSAVVMKTVTAFKKAFDTHVRFCEVGAQARFEMSSEGDVVKIRIFCRRCDCEKAFYFGAFGDFR